jgi:hypothetical protein
MRKKKRNKVMMKMTLIFNKMARKQNGDHP